LRANADRRLDVVLADSESEGVMIRARKVSGTLRG
jgi:hypothetical protein